MNDHGLERGGIVYYMPSRATACLYLCVVDGDVFEVSGERCVRLKVATQAYREEINDRDFVPAANLASLYRERDGKISPVLPRRFR